MTDEEFIKEYGRPPVKPGSHKKVKVYWGRIILALAILVLIIFGIVKLIMGIAGIVNSDDSSSSAEAKTVDTSVADDSDVAAVSSTVGKLRVCIDAGHGDYDGGTSSIDGTRLEKDDNLRVALKVRDYLEAKGVEVIMTRDDDSFVALDEICNIANNANADLFVSLHRNSSDGDYSGVEVWVHNAEPVEDTLLANNIMDALVAVGVNDNRGVGFGYIGDDTVNYQVNRCTNMPSCLVELGFMTNDSDNTLFDQNLEGYASGIADAIIKSAKALQIIDDDGNRLVETYLSSKPKASETQSQVTDEDQQIMDARPNTTD